MAKKKVTGYIEVWRVLNPEGSPIQWRYRRRALNGNKKGHESFVTRQGRNAAVRKILATEPGMEKRVVKDTISR